jgi:hypothetical protein
VTLIVSAADTRYFGLLQGLVSSCRDKVQGRDVPIGVLDLGMDGEQCAWLEAHRVALVRPSWDLDFPDRETTSATFMAQTARPFIPRYFPEHETYLWMDADTWIQDWGVVETYVAAARSGRIAITPEVDRCYAVTFDTARALGRYATYESVYGPEAAKLCGVNPTLNSGVFALRHDAPHWEIWAEELAKALQVTRSFYIEQLALNFSIYVRKAPAYFLSARYNWITCYSTPLLRPATGTFVEPSAPFSPIGIMHLTRDVKATPVRVAQADGSETWRTLEYVRPLDAGDPVQTASVTATGAASATRIPANAR